jgi:hypothetical protein
VRDGCENVARQRNHHNQIGKFTANQTRCGLFERIGPEMFLRADKDEESSSEESENEEGEEDDDASVQTKKEVFHSCTIPHHGGVNRIRVRVFLMSISYGDVLETRCSRCACRRQLACALFGIQQAKCSCGIWLRRLVPSTPLHRRHSQILAPRRTQQHGLQIINTH